MKTQKGSEVATEIITLVTDYDISTHDKLLQIDLMFQGKIILDEAELLAYRDRLVSAIKNSDYIGHRSALVDFINKEILDIEESSKEEKTN